MLRRGQADQRSLISLVKDYATLDVDPDGLTFLGADGVVAEEITKDSEYKGTRIPLDARMNNVHLRIQIDFGVGDVVIPSPRLIEYPTFLGGDTIQLLAYPVETAIAEKLQAMVALGGPNSRMKGLLRPSGSARSISILTRRMLWQNRDASLYPRSRCRSAHDEIRRGASRSDGMLA